MAEFKEISPNASVGDKLLNWVDNRSQHPSSIKSI